MAVYHLVCPQCGKSFTADRTRQIYCSRPCQYEAKKCPAVKKCAHCGEPFERRAALAARTTYCGRACFFAARPHATITARGYREVRVDGRYIQEHRSVMEQALGRPLLSSEVVHHKDSNKLNNDISNLELLPGQSEHMQTHGKTFRSETAKQCSKCRAVKLREEFYTSTCASAGRRDPHQGC
jgi:hypothetical protein